MNLIPPAAHLQHLDAGVFIAVEGLIGVGKSSFCCHLQQVRSGRRRCETFPEPVNKPAFKTLLERYYQDPARWGFAFQMYVLKERFKQHTLAAELVVNGVDVVQDRSIFADGVFGRMVCNDGNMTPEEWDIYAETFGALKRFLRYPDVIVYLRAEPEVCLERIKARARSAEGGIPLDYLRRLHQGHDELAEAMSRFTRVIRVDWQTFGNVEAVNQQIQEALAAPIGFLRDFNRL